MMVENAKERKFKKSPAESLRELIHLRHMDEYLEKSDLGDLLNP